jgi:predicted nucleic acid-binding protein
VSAVLVDTSVWIDLFRDRTGRRKATLRRALRRRAVVLSRFHQLELLQGAKDEEEWELLEDYLASQHYLEMSSAAWIEAARVFVDLRRRGLTVRSPIDCCIAVLAIENDVPLLHRDRDFETIATVRHLEESRVEWER